MQQTKHIPKDAQVIMSLLKELGISEYEPRVINQLLEFTYRYVTCILDDSKIYANHAKKKVIDLDDVKLASQMILDKAFTSPPPRDVLLDLTRIRNSSPLPLIKPNSGLRLPPDRYCLSSCNYRLKNKKQGAGSGLGSTNLKKLPILSQSAGIKRPPIAGGVSKVQQVTIPKPVFKFSNAKPAAATNPNMDPSASGVKRKRDVDDFEIVD